MVHSCAFAAKQLKHFYRYPVSHGKEPNHERHTLFFSNTIIV